MTRIEHPRGGGCIKLIVNDEHIARVIAAKRQLLQFDADRSPVKLGKAA